MAGAPVKPAPFAYAAPASLDEALGLLGGEQEAVALAGGQSLVPMLNFRLARPALLIDLNRIGELAGMAVLDGVLRIGSLTRQVALERSPVIARDWPLLGQAARLVAHPAIRTRGTVGGSAAHADPRAELPAALVALGARFRIVARGGARVVTAGEFFRGPFRSALQPGELLVEIEVPPLPAGARCAFAEHARTSGDYAIAGAAVILAPGTRAAIGLLGAGPVPVRAPAAEAALLAGAAAGEVASLAGSLARDEYRSALLTALVGRALAEVGA
jgi:CO/xanthine dehydrogenase FAD-binding subunit